MLREILHSIRSALSPRINYSVPVTIRGRRFWIPVWGGMEANVNDRVRQEVIGRFGIDEGAFVDIGVNLGQTLLDLRAVQPDRHYVGFEPNPTAVAYVLELIDRNDLPDCQIYPVGLSDVFSVSTLHRHPDDRVQASATLIENLRPDNDQVESEDVVLLPFDRTRSTILPDRQIAFVKIDVEGAELEVLQGMMAVLQEDRPPILCEVLPRCGGASREESESRRSRFCGLLQSHEYRIYHLELDGSLTEITGLRTGPYKRSESWDYVLLPDERTLHFDVPS